MALFHESERCHKVRDRQNASQDSKDYLDHVPLSQLPWFLVSSQQQYPLLVHLPTQYGGNVKVVDIRPVWSLPVVFALTLATSSSVKAALL